MPPGWSSIIQKLTQSTLVYPSILVSLFIRQTSVSLGVSLGLSRILLAISKCSLQDACIYWHITLGWCVKVRIASWLGVDIYQSQWECHSFDLLFFCLFPFLGSIGGTGLHQSIPISFRRLRPCFLLRWCNIRSFSHHFLT